MVGGIKLVRTTWCLHLLKEICSKQECIPVGCVPSALVAVGVGVSARGVFAQGDVCPGVSAQGGVCLGSGVSPGVCLPIRGVSTQGVSAPVHGEIHTPPMDRILDTRL